MAEEKEEETLLHGAINEEEARLHVKELDAIFNNMAWDIEEGILEAMKNAMTALK